MSIRELLSLLSDVISIIAGIIAIYEVTKQ